MTRARTYQAVACAITLVTALAGCADAPSPRASLSSPSSPANQPPAPSTLAPPREAQPPVAKPRLEAADVQGHNATTPARPATAWLTIPGLALKRLRVVPYRGTADDRPGTRIQNRGHAATPHGPRGGVGPGEVGNMIVTAHRTTAGKPFGTLPDLRVGEHVLVESGGYVFDYEITRTLTISFRSKRSRALQSLPVPGRPGVAADRGDDHAVHLRDARGLGSRQLLVGCIGQPGAPDRQGRSARRRPSGLTG